MAKTKGLGSVKRFGARYGLTVKTKVAIIERAQKKKHSCPFCKYEKVKRVSVGIWSCSKCGIKFANKAYSIVKPQQPKIAVEEV